MATTKRPKEPDFPITDELASEPEMGLELGLPSLELFPDPVLEDQPAPGLQALGEEAQDDDEEDEEAPPAAPAAPPPGLSAEMSLMMQQFKVLMVERDAQIMSQIDARLAGIRAELGARMPGPIGEPGVNGTLNHTAELAAAVGQHPPGMTLPGLAGPPLGSPLAAQQRAPRRMVAFIPKEDPYNPRQTTFRTWINGRELRAKRGQVMILSLGHGIDLAKNGHGNCVDIAAMQGMGVAEPLPVAQTPDYSRPDDWSGMPLYNRSSIPV